MEVRVLIKALVTAGIDPEDAGTTQITNATISGHGYRECDR